MGCVAGEKRVDMYSTEGAVSGGEGLYWKYESWRILANSRFK